MTDEIRMEIFRLHHHRIGTNEIARRVGVWPHSVRWVLRRGELLKKERAKRAASGASEYTCAKCGQKGHNRMSCGVERP